MCMCKPCSFLWVSSRKLKNLQFCSSSYVLKCYNENSPFISPYRGTSFFPSYNFGQLCLLPKIRYVGTLTSKLISTKNVLNDVQADKSMACNVFSQPVCCWQYFSPLSNIFRQTFF